MMLVITTQLQENYGAHNWDGEGACPQYWKMKGGSEYKILGIPADCDPDEIAELVRTVHCGAGCGHEIGNRWRGPRC